MTHGIDVVFEGVGRKVALPHATGCWYDAPSEGAHMWWNRKPVAETDNHAALRDLEAALGAFKADVHAVIDSSPATPDMCRQLILELSDIRQRFASAQIPS